ncbi:TonB family protein [Luteolibacter yonseiensis]|uniref:TonB family protein n=1 Tax=Luteolibacter yonseiensis TaxID=1144680 RepID=A0A934R258_9BACT|nr:energy transducer TonB [Luteolibacter yonseiensis]MBK1815444.1 TonB family protein [Luteolibacter yonseiensis]
MKDSLLHALDIGTLALWASVTLLAAVAIGVPSSIPQAAVAAGGMTTEIGSDFLIGDTPDESPEEDWAKEMEENTTMPAKAALPSPPSMAPRKSVSPLPEIPKLPRPPGRAVPSSSIDTRLAAGHTPGPAYPAAARAAGQTGTVVMSFTVNGAGKVVSAFVYTSSGWPLLDQEALRTVKTWTFPPGEAMALIRPLVFELP